MSRLVPTRLSLGFMLCVYGCFWMFLIHFLRVFALVDWTVLLRAPRIWLVFPRLLLEEFRTSPRSSWSFWTLFPQAPRLWQSVYGCPWQNLTRFLLWYVSGSTLCRMDKCAQSMLELLGFCFWDFTQNGEVCSFVASVALFPPAGHTWKSNFTSTSRSYIAVPCSLSGVLPEW